MRNFWQAVIGIALIIVGLYFSSFGTRPWIDYDFILTWYGFLLVMDLIGKKLTGYSVFADLRAFAILAFSSGFFWTFYEWVNIFLKNWAYPVQPLYNQVEWEVFSTAAFTTVLPHLVISTNIIKGSLFIKPINFVQNKLSKTVLFTFPILGIVFLVATIVFPIFFFPLTWFVLFFILDPINAFYGRRSLIVQILKKNYKPALLLTVAALFAGFWWETINFFVPKWVYPIVPWFWQLPAPITTKYIQMPLAGFLGYIPFIFSAFSFVEFLKLPVKWLNGLRD